MQRNLKQNTARSVDIWLTDATDPMKGLPGKSASMTVTLGKNGGADVALNGTITDRGGGRYSLNLTTTDTNTIGDLSYNATCSGANDSFGLLGEVVAGTAADFITDSGTAQGGAAAYITLAATASSVNDYYDGQTVLIVSGTGAGQCRMIGTYVGATKNAGVNIAWQTAPDNTSVYKVIGAADLRYLYAIQALIYPNTNTIITNLASLDTALVAARGTASAGAANTITLTGASAVDGAYVGMLVAIISGTGAGQTGIVSGYVGATKVATMIIPWTTHGVAPDATSVFVVLRTASEGHDFTYPTAATPYSKALDINADTDDIQTRIPATGEWATFLADFGNFSADQYSSMSEVSTMNGNVTVLLNGLIVRKELAAGGGATTITLDAGASATDGAYVGMTIWHDKSSTADARTITAYNGATKVATVDRAWTVNPAGGGTTNFTITASNIDLTTLVASIYAYAYESGKSVKGLFCGLEAVFFGKAEGLNGTNPKVYRSDGTTVAADYTQDPGPGDRDAADVTGRGD